MKFIFLILLVVAIYFIYQRGVNNKQMLEQNHQQAAEFLAKNKTEAGVIETDSGLQYLILHKGDSEQQPKASDTVKVHYHGTLLDGTVFDSSVERNTPISFALKQVIKGWTEGLQLMTVGDKVRFFIPANLAYGDRATGKITPGAMLIFDVELLAIN